MGPALALDSDIANILTENLRQNCQFVSMVGVRQARNFRARVGSGFSMSGSCKLPAKPEESTNLYGVEVVTSRIFTSRAFANPCQAGSSRAKSSRASFSQYIKNYFLAKKFESSRAEPLFGSARLGSKISELARLVTTSSMAFKNAWFSLFLFLY